MAAKRKEDVVRCFDVSDPTLHPKGHTIYKITQKLIPVESPEKNVQQIVVWRRYNDLKKLYKAMFKLHKALHRKEEFPPFAKATAFGRFDKEIIIERQRCAQDLLNFIGQRHYFIISKAFQQFFQDGEKSEVLQKDSGILQPCRLTELTQDDEVASSCTQDSDIESINSDFVVSAEGNSSTSSPAVNRKPRQEIPSEMDASDLDAEVLGGVWRYRQIADRISLGEIDDDENTDFTDDSTLSTPLPSAEVAFFDPFSVQSSDKNGERAESNNEWLLAAMESCGLEPGTQDTPTSSGTPDASISQEATAGQQETKAVPPKQLTINQKPTFFFENSSEDEKADSKPNNGIHISASCDNINSNSKATVQHGKGDLNFSPLSKPEAPTLTTSSSATALNQSSSTSQLTSSKKTLSVPGKEPGQELPRITSLLNLDTKDKGDYIFQAAHQISLGQQCEASGNYHMAFNYIRTGVGILLTGVQLDENSARREVVRRKTAKYLVKAEKLHKKYLESNGDNSITDRWDPGKISPTKVLEPQAACLQGSFSELNNYKVIGVVDKVTLVIDSVTENTYIMKVLQKTLAPNNKRRNVVPTDCPFMVKLHRFFETDHAIILVLQHAPGGKLWNYISKYLHSNNSNGIDDLLSDEHEKELRYAGRTQITSENVHKKSNDNIDKKLHYDQSKNECTKFYSNSTKQSESDVNLQISLGNKSGKVSFKAESNDFHVNCGKKNTPSGEHHTENFNSKGTNSEACINNNSNVIDEIKRYDTEKSSLLMGQTSSQFQDLLKSASEKPTMEAFSVNSFESDSGPSSRFESTADHIESIQEVSETNSPLASPKKVNEDKSHFTDVFQEESSSDKENIIRSEVSSHKADNFVDETNKMLKDLDKEIHETDKAFHEFLKSDEVFTSDNKTSPKRDQSINNSHLLHSTPAKQTLSNSVESIDEKCIYDYYNRSPSVNSTDSLPDACHNVKDLIATIQNENEITSEKSSEKLKDDCHLSKNIVFKQPSQERSLEMSKKARNRTASGLSSVFGDLDLVSDDKPSSLRLPENCVRQWAAELVVAIEHLHWLGLACRDLNPDNLLLGSRGHVILSYFSQWSLVDKEIPQSIVDQFYTAPEVIGLDEYSTACDWWSLGALLFELFTGKKLYQYYPSGITSHTQLEIPGELSSEAKALLIDLLKFSPEERLGGTGGNIEDIKSHPFFQGINWKELSALKLWE